MLDKFSCRLYLFRCRKYFAESKNLVFDAGFLRSRCRAPKWSVLIHYVWGVPSIDTKSPYDGHPKIREEGDDKTFGWHEWGVKKLT